MTSSKVEPSSFTPKGYSLKFKGAMAFLVILAIADLYYIFNLIAYTRENKPNDEF